MDISTSIPGFPDSRILLLSDKPLLDALFAELQPRISEFTFAGLYLFRIPHNYRLTMAADALVVLGKGYAGETYFLPPLTGGVAGALAVMFDAGFSLYGGDEAFVARYLSGEELCIVEDRDSFDYLYLRSDLADLPGNRFHKKKNRINYFSSRHAHSVELFGELHIKGCLDLLEEWQRVRADMANSSVGPEVESNVEALSMAAKLALEGVVVLVEGRVKAFSLGERLNSTTSVCHFEKADPFIEGISQLVEREFNRLLFTDCIWVNREQDLGEPGLRTAKLSYHPVELVKKFRANKRLQGVASPFAASCLPSSSAAIE